MRWANSSPAGCRRESLRGRQEPCRTALLLQSQCLQGGGDDKHPSLGRPEVQSQETLDFVHLVPWQGWGQTQSPLPTFLPVRASWASVFLPSPNLSRDPGGSNQSEGDSSVQPSWLCPCICSALNGACVSPLGVVPTPDLPSSFFSLFWSHLPRSVPSCCLSDLPEGHVQPQNLPAFRTKSNLPGAQAELVRPRWPVTILCARLPAGATLHTDMAWDVNPRVWDTAQSPPLGPCPCWSLVPSTA